MVSRLLALGALLVVPALAGDDVPLVIVAGKVLTMNEAGDVFDPGMIVVEDGRITYVGAVIAFPAGATISG